MTWNSQFQLICNFTNHFSWKWLRMTQNSQFCPIHFSNLLPPKWLQMTWNSQFCPIHNFPPSFPTEATQNDLEWPISTDLQLYQSFLMEVAQNDSEWPILPNSLFQSFATKVAQNDSDQAILPDS